MLKYLFFNLPVIDLENSWKLSAEANVANTKAKLTGESKSYDHRCCSSCDHHKRNNWSSITSGRPTSGYAS
jgi:hypothetical protein